MLPSHSWGHVGALFRSWALLGRFLLFASLAAFVLALGRFLCVSGLPGFDFGRPGLDFGGFRDAPGRVLEVQKPYFSELLLTRALALRRSCECAKT